MHTYNPTTHPPTCSTNIIKQTRTHMHKLTNKHTELNTLDFLMHTSIVRVYKPLTLQHRSPSEECGCSIRYERAGERKRERSKAESCLHLNCSALRLFNLIMRLHFIEPGCCVPFKMKLSLRSAGQAASPRLLFGGNAGPPCPLKALFSRVAGEMLKLTELG